MTRHRILIVDDSTVARAFVVQVLRQAGHEVLEAQDGAEGAMLALRQQPDAVVTDLEMPTMDGYQLARLLKTDPAARHIPLVILTSHAEASSRFWGLHTGADAYVTKEALGDQLLTTLDELLRRAPAKVDSIAEPPGGPLEVLARVARQLDERLLQATVTNTLMARSVGSAKLVEVIRAALEVISQVVDAKLLAVAASDEHAVTVNILFPKPMPPSVGEEAVRELIGLLGDIGERELRSDVVGAADGAGGGVDFGELITLDLPLRDAVAVLALVPRETSSYERFARPLIDELKGHLSLVLDNARLSERLRELSTIDGLTRLLNHRSIYQRLEEEIHRGTRYRQPLSVVLCDIDHFKRVNDTYGHLAGDAVLKGLAAVLRAHLRACDAVGRYGGEEFLIILPSTELPAACLAAERLRRAVAGSILPLPEQSELGITASFGVAARSELEAPELSAVALVSLADRRLYASKERGRDTVTPCGPPEPSQEP